MSVFSCQSSCLSVTMSVSSCQSSSLSTPLIKKWGFGKELNTQSSQAQEDMFAAVYSGFVVFPSPRKVSPNAPRASRAPLAGF